MTSSSVSTSPATESEQRQIALNARSELSEQLRSEIERENTEARASRRRRWQGGLLDANGLLLLAR